MPVDSKRGNCELQKPLSGFSKLSVLPVEKLLLLPLDLCRAFYDFSC